MRQPHNKPTNPSVQLIALLGVESCSKKEAPPTPAAVASAAMPVKAADKALTVGFIYVGPKDDYGYNQAHAEGAQMVAKMPGVKIREEEKVP